MRTVVAWYDSELKADEAHGLMHSINKVLIRDDCYRPKHIKVPAQYAELWAKRNKKNLLLNIGESWTYGEGLQDIATAIGKFDLGSMLRHSFGARLANMLDTDFYQYAVPGNSNLAMSHTLKRILKELDTSKYEKIYLCFQVTEPSREMQQLNELVQWNHPLKNLYDKKYLAENKLDLQQWLEKYDSYLYSYIDDIVSNYTNVNTVVWKNFCCTNTTGKYNFKIIDESWIQFSAKTNGYKINMPSFYNAGWLDDLMRDYKEISFKHKYIGKQLKVIEQSNKYLGSCPDHRPHPMKVQHSLWAANIYHKSGWANEQ